MLKKSYGEEFVVNKLQEQIDKDWIAEQVLEEISEELEEMAFLSHEELESDLKGRILSAIEGEVENADIADNFLENFCNTETYDDFTNEIVKELIEDVTEKFVDLLEEAI